jgi:tripartite-type tricarboxylate transporter receptor subunit TctC
LLAAAAVAAVALASASEGYAGPVYDGKNVTLIVPNSAGGLMTQYAQMLAPEIQKHLGAANVRVDNQPGAGGLKGTNALAQAAPDGMTIGFTNIPALIMAQLADSPGVRFDATKFAYLGRVAAEPRLMVVGSQSKIKTFDDVIHLDRPFLYASQGTDEDFYTMAVLADTFGYQLKAITGYEGDADTALAVIKGDVDGNMTGWSATVAAIQAGEKRPIVFVTTERRPEAPDVPTALELTQDATKQKQLRAVTSILDLSRGFYGPAGMDPAATEEMRAAIEATLTDPAVVDAAAKRGMPIVFEAGAEQQKKIADVTAAAAGLTPVLKNALAAIQ